MLAHSHPEAPVYPAEPAPRVLARAWERRRKIFWRGDRIEQVLSRGCHDGFVQEIREERVPGRGNGIPGPRPGGRRSGATAASG